MKYAIVAEKRGDPSSREVWLPFSAEEVACFAAWIARGYPRHVVYLKLILLLGDSFDLDKA